MPEMEPPIVRGMAKLPVEDLRVSSMNVRLEPDPKGIDLLAESIRTIGLQHPLVVRPVPDEQGVHEVIEGSRRLYALKMLGYRTVECRVIDMNDQQALVASVHENIVRGDITAAELARGIQRMMEMMPPGWDDRKRRREAARLLTWFVTDPRGRKRPDLTRVKDALLMGEFQEKLPGVVIKLRSRGDSRKPTLAWSTARQVRDIVSAPGTQEVLNRKPPEERSTYVMGLAKTYKEVPTKHRPEFVERLSAFPDRPPEEVAKEIQVREAKSFLLTARAEPELREAIDSFASALDLKRPDAIIKLLRQALAQAGYLSSSALLREPGNS